MFEYNAADKVNKITNYNNSFLRHVLFIQMYKNAVFIVAQLNFHNAEV